MELIKSDSDHYYLTEGHGVPIVFLHGFPDCPENYKDQFTEIVNSYIKEQI